MGKYVAATLFGFLAMAATVAAQVYRVVESPEATSLLGRGLYGQPDTKGEVAKADAALAADPQNLDLLLAAARARDNAMLFRKSIELYSKAVALAPADVRPYRWRGHRYISTRRFEAAVRDLEKARQMAPGSFDVSYHLALAYYLQGEFDRAATEYQRCLDQKGERPALPKDWRSCAEAAADEDSRVALSDWLYRALRRAGRHEQARALLESIHDRMAVKSNESYYRALLFYKGLRTEGQVLDPATVKGNMLSTIGYGVANFHLMDGRKEQACSLVRRILDEEAERWNAFGYIAAEVEVARGTCRRWTQ